MDTCPECRSILPEGETCQSLFDQFLVLEFTDPGYGAVHFLTVACFMVQHGRYSGAGREWIKDKLRAYLEEGRTIEQIRADAGQSASQDRRDFKITRQPGDPPPPVIAWSMTIADVAQQFEGPESYRELIVQWARVTLKEMDGA